MCRLGPDSTSSFHFQLRGNTCRLYPDKNRQEFPTPSIDAEVARKTDSHGTAAKVPLISWEDGLPVKYTKIWWTREKHHRCCFKFVTELLVVAAVVIGEGGSLTVLSLTCSIWNSRPYAAVSQPHAWGRVGSAIVEYSDMPVLKLVGLVGTG